MGGVRLGAHRYSLGENVELSPMLNRLNHQKPERRKNVERSRGRRGSPCSGRGTPALVSAPGKWIGAHGHILSLLQGSVCSGFGDQACDYSISPP